MHIQLTCLVSLPPRAFLSPLLLYPPFLLCSTLSSFFRFSVPFAPSPRCFGLPFSGRPRSVSFASPHEHTGARARLISSYLKYRRQNNGVSICAERDRSFLAIIYRVTVLDTIQLRVAGPEHLPSPNFSPGPRLKMPISSTIGTVTNVFGCVQSSRDLSLRDCFPLFRETNMSLANADFSALQF